MSNRINHPPAADFCSPESLSVHPDLTNFPPLSDDRIAALNKSIKEHGVQEPLICDQHRQVYSGRARLQIALALELSAIPIIIRPEANVLMFAIENAVNRRQLTCSGIAFLLFEHQPELASRRGKAGRPNKCSTVEHLSASHESYRQIGARYRVHPSYFGYLAEMKAGSSDEEWAQLRHLILHEEASIPRQYAGFSTGLKAGSKRGPVVYASVNEQGVLDGILPRAFSSIREGFLRWSNHEIDSKAKAAVEREWAQLLDEAPPELLRIAQRKAALK
jgi:hypothetical protein